MYQLEMDQDMTLTTMELFQNRQRQTDAVSKNTHAGPGFLAIPKVDGRVPGIVVLQEVFGLNDDIRRIAREFAMEGYAVFAPDLYEGLVTSDLDEARKLRSNMDTQKAGRDIDEAVRYLKSLDVVGGGPVGVIGFCMGGSLSLGTAIRNESIGAAAVFYGGGGVPENLDNIRCPIFGAYGIEDTGIPIEAVDALREALDAQSIDNEIHIYDKAGHSFFNDVMPGSYRSEVAELSRQHVLAFFGRVLGA